MEGVAKIMVCVENFMAARGGGLLLLRAARCGGCGR